MEVFIWFCQTHLALDLAKLTFKIGWISCFPFSSASARAPSANWCWNKSLPTLAARWKCSGRKLERVLREKLAAACDTSPPPGGRNPFFSNTSTYHFYKKHFCDTFLGHKLLGHFCSSPLFWGHISVSDFQETPLSHTSGTSWAAAQQCFHSHISRSLLPVMGCSTTCFPPRWALFPLNFQVTLDWGLAPI